MLTNFLSNISLPAFLSRRARIALAVLIVLSPAAYLASATLLLKIDPNIQSRFQIGRDEALGLAARYAFAELHTDVAQWTRGCHIETSNDRHLYFRLHSSAPDTWRAERLLPENVARVVFIRPQGNERIEVMLAPNGEVLGFSRTLPAKEEIQDAGEAAARKLAEASARDFAARENLTLTSAPELKEQRSFNRVTRSYTWHTRFASLPELDIAFVVTVIGDVVTAQEIKSEINEAYASRNLLNHAIAPNIAIALSYVLIVLFSLYGLYRYIQRARQKEVPHARSLLLCLVIAVAYMFIALQTDFQQFALPAGANQTIVFWIIIVSTGVVFLLLGLAVGLAYGSSEGDTREAYPGKLTSLDALLTGRVFSRNVAQAVCIGAALGGWVWLARTLVLLPWLHRPDAGRGLMDKSFSILLGHYPSLLPLMIAPLGAIIIAVPGLLLPLSFLRGRVKQTKWLLAILVLLSLIINGNVFQDRPLVFGAGVLTACVMVAALLASFFIFDVLTTIVALTATVLGGFIWFLITQPAPSLHAAGYKSLAVVLIVLAVELFFFYKGREYAEDEVRPLYARHLAERLTLQAEVNAAREAQIRLLPAELPKVSGLALAAACHPAHTVGGDFYDLFALDEKRLGVFVAEGGSHGLEAAMIIAFAKGFLMPRLSARYTPGEIICGLQTQLAPMLNRDQTLALVYAVVDAEARTLDYACIGVYPEVVINQGAANGHSGRAANVVHMKERERIVTGAGSSSSSGGDANCLVREASVQLAPGEAVVFYTDGIAKSIGAQRKASIARWVASVVRASSNDSFDGEMMQASLVKSFERASRLARRGKLEDDDLTAVIVQLARQQN